MTPLLRHLILFLLCVSLIASITSCEQTDVASDKKIPQHENILRYDVNAPFTSLNPTEVECSGSNNIFPLLYSYLFVPNTNGELEPDLAVKWAYDAESFTWTIHLRNDARFHNRQSVTSSDIKHSLETTVANVRPYMSSLIKKITPLSDTALTVFLRKHDPDFPKKIWDIEIISQPNGDKIDYYNHPIGSGPFRFAYRNGEKEVVLVANEDYYNGSPSLGGVVFYYQPDKEKVWTRLLSGKTDIAQEVSPKNYDMMRQYEDRYYFDRYILPFYTILLYNTADPLFSDPKVRMALSHAIDREYIVEKILQGCGVLAVGPLGVNSPYHNPALKPIPCSPRKALRLLKEAGWSYDHKGHYLSKEGKPFEFTMLVYDEHQSEKEIGRYIKLSLNDIGIRMQLRSLPFKEVLRRYYRNNDFQAVITELSAHYRKPECLQYLWNPHGTDKSAAGCFENIEVTRLIHCALDEKDPLKQKELFYRIDTLITSLQPGTFLFQKTAIDAMSKRFILPFPFYLTHEGIYHLKSASLNKN